MISNKTLFPKILLKHMTKMIFQPILSVLYYPCQGLKRVAIVKVLDTSETFTCLLPSCRHSQGLVLAGLANCILERLWQFLYWMESILITTSYCIYHAALSGNVRYVAITIVNNPQRNVST